MSGKFILAFEPDQKVFEGNDVENEPAGSMQFDLAPMLAARCGERCLDDSKILRAAGIGENDQVALVMVDGIVVLRLARRDERPTGSRFVFGSRFPHDQVVARKPTTLRTMRCSPTGLARRLTT